MRAAPPPAPAPMLSRCSYPLTSVPRLASQIHHSVISAYGRTLLPPPPTVSLHNWPLSMPYNLARRCKTAPCSPLWSPARVFDGMSSVQVLSGHGLLLLPHYRAVDAAIASYQAKSTRWRPIFALETGGSPSPDDQDFEDIGFLGRTRLGRLIQAAARELLKKLNSARTKSPTKIFLVLLGFYTANALATILGQTGDWDVLVAGVIVAAIEGIGMLMYRKPVARTPGRFQSLISMINFWKAGVCLGLFVDAFKLGS